MGNDRQIKFMEIANTFLNFTDDYIPRGKFNQQTSIDLK